MRFVLSRRTVGVASEASVVVLGFDQIQGLRRCRCKPTEQVHGLVLGHEGLEGLVVATIRRDVQRRAPTPIERPDRRGTLLLKDGPQHRRVAVRGGAVQRRRLVVDEPPLRRGEGRE